MVVKPIGKLVSQHAASWSVGRLHVGYVFDLLLRMLFVVHFVTTKLRTFLVGNDEGGNRGSQLLGYVSYLLTSLSTFDLLLTYSVPSIISWGTSCRREARGVFISKGRFIRVAAEEQFEVAQTELLEEVESDAIAPTVLYCFLLKYLFFFLKSFTKWKA